MGNLQLIGKGRLAEVYAWGDSQVLKLFATGQDTATIETEARVSKIVYEAGVASPRAHGVIEFEGRRGIIFDRVDGSSMLRLLGAKPWKISAYGRMLATLHASIHQCSADALPSQLDQLEDLIGRADLPAAQRDLALTRLRAMPAGTAICHGDFHPDNVLINGNNATIIDWTNACFGNPLADFVRTSLILQLGAPHPDASSWTRITVGVGRALFHRYYTKRYMQINHLRPRDIQPWLYPIAVARLGANVTVERDQLLTLINQKAK